MTHRSDPFQILAAAYADHPARLRVALFGYLMGALHASKDADGTVGVEMHYQAGEYVQEDQR
jgi:hypothetical protein